MMKCYTADFETLTYLEGGRTRIWSYGICEIEHTSNFTYGTSMAEFLARCNNGDNDTLYFHNLAFDGIFIISSLFEMGFKHVLDRKESETNTFTTLISDMGAFYSIEITFKKQGKHVRKVTLYDSLKIINMPVKDVAKSFNLPIKKGDINYDEIRDKAHKITDSELSYLRNDCEIMARALHVLFNEGLDAMTQGANALQDYKGIVDKKRFERCFPHVDYDKDIRQSYKGGFTYVNPKFKGKVINEGIVLDVNSLYPSVMYEELMPFGEGKHYNGEYEFDKIFPLYVHCFKCDFKIKPNHIPTLQLKNNPSYIGNEYVLCNNEDDEEPLFLTSIDMKLFYEHYDVFNEEHIGGWKFKAVKEDKEKGTKGLFNEYIDKWSARKIKAKEEHNAGQYTIAKLFLNSLYGKFASSPEGQSKIPYMGENGIVKFRLGEVEDRKSLYIPVGTFITAYARYKTITSAQKVYSRFCYADTDSLHLEGTEIPEGLEISDTKLGAWKHESTFYKAKFLRQKSYIELSWDIKKCLPINRPNGVGEVVNNTKFKHTQSHMQVTCSGMSKGCYPNVTFDNFELGQDYEGKLKPTHVVGGIILEDTSFTIKEAKVG